MNHYFESFDVLFFQRSQLLLFLLLKGVDQGGFKSETMRKSLLFAKEEEMLYVHVITQGVLKNTQEDED
jgi:hypothetical protein